MLRVRHLTLHSLNASSQKRREPDQLVRPDAKSWTCSPKLQRPICCFLKASSLCGSCCNPGAFLTTPFQGKLESHVDLVPSKVHLLENVVFAPMAPDDIGRNTLAAAMAGWVQPATMQVGWRARLKQGLNKRRVFHRTPSARGEVCS